jgi:hypothetical protein
VNAVLFRFDGVILEQLQALLQSLTSMLISHLTELSFRAYQTEDVASQALLLNVWHRSLLFQRWLYPANVLPSFGKAVVAKLLLQPHDAIASRSRLYLAALSIVQEECRFGGEAQQEEYLEVVLASYLAFYNECDDKSAYCEKLSHS